MDHPPRKYVDHFQGVVAQRGNKQSAPFGVRSEVIQPARNARDGNLFFQLQREKLTTLRLRYGTFWVPYRQYAQTSQRNHANV